MSVVHARRGQRCEVMEQVSSLLMSTKRSLVSPQLYMLTFTTMVTSSAIMVSGGRDGLVIVWDTRYNNRGEFLIVGWMHETNASTLVFGEQVFTYTIWSFCFKGPITLHFTQLIASHQTEPQGRTLEDMMTLVNQDKSKQWQLYVFLGSMEYYLLALTGMIYHFFWNSIKFYS